MSGPLEGEPTLARPAEETPTLVVATEEPRELLLTPGTMLLDRYRIVSLLGRGGMGEVYRADDLKLGQPVALKFLAGRALERHLLDEVRIGRQVSHPNVCRLYDIAEIGGRPFITMEFVSGEDLASLLRRIGHLPHDKALSVARDICAGLAAAHESGVVHRDLKPGNVMIDGRGRARITDFGLAAFENSSEHAGAGTPAYMAPEQFAGERATIRSDIYALGLVLYEIFTGHRVFEAMSMTELITRQREQRFPPPSALVSDVTPQVEQAILHALHPSPDQRPASVEELMAELPQFDALKAAIAAGETPTPGMVAAAGERGDLSRGAAWGLLLVTIIGLVAYAALASRALLIRRLPVLKSPEVLLERVEEIVAATKQPLVRADSAIYIYSDNDQLAQREKHPLDITPIQFYWRQSPRAMAASGIFDLRVLPNAPPLNVPGMADVATDMTGRLLEYTVVPARYEKPPEHTTLVDWSPFLTFARIRGPLTSSPSYWSAPVDSDAKQAWTASDGTRIEAASYHGKPVWFAVIPPWRKVEDSSDLRKPPLIVKLTVASAMATIGIIVAYLAIALWLAARNLRRGQGDRNGAKALAAFLLATTIISQLFRAHHPPEPPAELGVLLRILLFSMFCAALAWFGYIAIEPLVRRRWPRMLISWSRLLEGRFRDPIIGRDLLIGTTASIVFALLWELPAVVPGNEPLNYSLSTLASPRNLIYFLGTAIIEGVVGGIAAPMLLLALRAITRSLRVSIVIYGLVCALVFFADATGPVWARSICAAAVVGTALLLLFRFGLLALSFAGMALFFLRPMPITLDPTAWYFGRSLFALLLIAAFALYGFVVALGGKRVFPEMAID